MEQQEKQVLDAFYKNASVGLDATCSILDKAAHPELREELCKQLRYYQTQKDSIRRQMQENCLQPQEQGELAKLCSNLSIRMHCAGGISSGEIAKLMLKGTNMGVIQLTEVLHRSPEISDSLKHQGKEIVRHEEAYMERLKAYL